MKKYFIASDIHGFYKLWMKALTEKGFDINNPDHIIVVLGDLLDRGPEPVKCLQFVNNLPAERKILIRGNHEDLMESMLYVREEHWNDLHNGTFDSMLNIYDFLRNGATEFGNTFKVVESSKIWRHYVDSTVDYYETDTMVFVHGWIPCRTIVDCYYFDDNWRTGKWESARWTNGMKAWQDGAKIDGKTIYCGHWHSSYGHSKIEHKGPEFGPTAIFTPFKADGIVAMDACTAYSGLVNVEVVEEAEKTNN